MRAERLLRVVREETEPAREGSVTPVVGDPALRTLLARIFPQIADWDEVARRVARGASLADTLENLRRVA